MISKIAHNREKRAQKCHFLNRIRKIEQYQHWHKQFKGVRFTTFCIFYEEINYFLEYFPVFMCRITFYYMATLQLSLTSKSCAFIQSVQCSTRDKCLYRRTFCNKVFINFFLIKSELSVVNIIFEYQNNKLEHKSQIIRTLQGVCAACKNA